ncbi:MAG: recombinase family protein, partial [Dehalococcoidia bacterium]
QCMAAIESIACEAQTERRSSISASELTRCGQDRLEALAMRLNAAGIRTPMGRRWEHASVASVLKNPVYTGALVWNRKSKAKINAPSPDGSLRPPARNTHGERNERDQWLVIEDAHEPLVDADLWQRAQDAIARRSRMGGLARPTNRYLLSGLVKCVHCGFNYVGRIGCSMHNRKRYYSDGAYLRYGRQGCDPSQINAEILDTFVLAQLRQIVGRDQAAIEQAVEQFVKAVQAKTEPEERRGGLEAELKAVQKRIDSVMALLSDGELDGLAELRETLVNLRRRREALQAELATAEHSAVVPMKAADLRTWARSRLAEIGTMLSEVENNQTLREVVQAYVIRIDVDAKAKRGTLVLPADTLAILESDLTSFSRVKPGDAGFDAVKTAFLASGTIRLAVLTGDSAASGTEGPLGDFSITNFSRNEPLEEGVTVSVTAKLAVFEEWVEV